MITSTYPTTWKELQNKVGAILRNCGFKVEIEKKINSARAPFVADVYAEEEIDGRKYSIICECKYWNSNVPQVTVHGFRTQVDDAGCNLGLMITTSSFQSGSYETSKFTNIELLTWTDFQLRFFETWYSKYFSPTLSDELSEITSKDLNDVGWFDDLTGEDKRKFSSLRNKLNEICEVVSYFQPGFLLELQKLKPPKLPLKGNLAIDDFSELPSEILIESNYQTFLEKFISYAMTVFEEFRELESKYQQS